MDWRHFGPRLNLDDQDSARQFKAVVERVKNMLGAVTDVFTERIQPKAEKLGEDLCVQEYSRKLFSEEVLRSSLFSAVSVCLNKIEPELHRRCNIGEWLVISRGRQHGSHGVIKYFKTLYEVVQERFDEKTVLLVSVI